MNAHDHIDDYKAGLLSGEQLAAFESALASDENLRRLVDNYDEIKSVSEGVLELQLLNELSGIHHDKVEPEKKKKTHIDYMMLASILLCLAAAAFYLFFQPKQEKEEPVLFADVYREPIWPTTRSTTNDRSDTYYQGKAASEFLNGDLATAKVILLDSMEDKALGRYWLAEMYMAQQELDSVVVYLPQSNDLSSKTNRINKLQQWIKKLRDS